MKRNIPGLIENYDSIVKNQHAGMDFFCSSDIDTIYRTTGDPFNLISAALKVGFAAGYKFAKRNRTGGRAGK